MQTEITTKVLMTNEALYKLLDDEGFTFEGAYDIEDTYYSSLGGKEKVKEIDYQTLISHSMIVRKVTSELEGEECLIYKNNYVNIFGAIMLCLLANILCPIVSICYWIYKLCTVGGEIK